MLITRREAVVGGFLGLAGLCCSVPKWANRRIPERDFFREFLEGQPRTLDLKGLRECLVDVIQPSGSRRGYGRGIYIGDGFYLTAHHVVDQADKLIIGKQADDRYSPAKILYVDPTKDLALLRSNLLGGNQVTININPELYEDVVYYLQIMSECNIPINQGVLSYLGCLSPSVINEDLFLAEGHSLPWDSVRYFIRAFNEDFDPPFFSYNAVSVVEGHSGGPILLVDGEGRFSLGGIVSSATGQVDEDDRMILGSSDTLYVNRAGIRKFLEDYLTKIA